MRLVVDARTSALASVIDYAGVFPPASLSVRQAVTEYRDARTSGAYWMLGRFLIRASQLEDLAGAAMSTMTSGEAAWDISVIFDSEPGEAASLASEFHAEMEPAMVVSAAEARIVDTSAPGIESLFTTATSISPEVVPFLEIERTDDITRQVHSLAKAIEHANRPGGAKIRCGGVTPDQFPEPDLIAEFITATTDSNLPFKATAGLHRPFRHFDDDLGVYRHGFLNILLAAAASAQGENRPTVTDIISESDPTAFNLSSAFARWRDMTVPGSALRRIRQRHFIGYGSCDFNEPVEALTELGMIGDGS